MHIPLNGFLANILMSAPSALANKAVYFNGHTTGLQTLTLKFTGLAHVLIRINSGRVKRYRAKIESTSLQQFA